MADDVITDPLTPKGNEIMKHMKSEYGAKEAEKVFYASKNKGTISGVDDGHLPVSPTEALPMTISVQESYAKASRHWEAWDCNSHNKPSGR